MLVLALITIGTPQSGPRVPPRDGLGILAGRGLERLPLQYLLDRPVDPVIPVNPRKVPPDDLRDRVLVLGVVALELRHRHFEKVAVHRVRRGCLQSRRR